MNVNRMGRQELPPGYPFDLQRACPALVPAATRRSKLTSILLGLCCLAACLLNPLQAHAQFGVSGDDGSGRFTNFQGLEVNGQTYSGAIEYGFFVTDNDTLDPPLGDLPGSDIAAAVNALQMELNGVIDPGALTFLGIAEEEESASDVRYSGVIRTSGNTWVASSFRVNDGANASALQGLITWTLVPSTVDTAAGQLTGSTGQTVVSGAHHQFGVLGGQINRAARSAGAGGALVINLPAPLDVRADVQLAGFQTSQLPVIRAQSSPLLSGGWDGWAVGYGISGDVDGDGTVAGLDYVAGGTQFGLYRMLCEGTLVGVFGTYGYQDVETTANADSQVNSGLFGAWLYRGDCCGNYYILAGAGGYDHYDTARTTATGTARGETDGGQVSAYLERGWSRPWRCVVIEPSVSLGYVHVGQDGFTETGAGANNQTVNDTDTDSLRSQIGGRIRGERCTCHGVLRPMLRAHWMHEFLDTNTAVTGTSTAAFATRGVDFGRDYAVLGIGGSLERSACLTIFANYDAQLNDRTALHVGSAGLQWIW